MKKQSRRDFCKDSLMGLSTLSLSQIPFASMANNQDDDHFFIHFHANGGWDSSYLFDARPLQMTADKIIHNYNGVEPTLYRGSNGTTCLVAESAKPLLPLTDYFSVINGVVMDSSDGHPQNANVLFTGNPFGGKSFLPFISENSSLNETSIDGLIQGNLVFSRPSNHGKIIPLGGPAGGNLIDQLKSHPMINSLDPTFQFIRQRFLANSQGTGLFSKANQGLISAFDKQESLYHKLESLNLGNSSPNQPEKYMVELLQSLFKKKVARLALIELTIPESFGMMAGFDAHDVETALLQPQVFTHISQTLAKYINLLRNTAYDNGRSMYDVTTFIVTSEFSRTMRSPFGPFEETGTEHNQYSNSFLVGGKKIRTGQVIGQSDCRLSTEVLSPAHLAKDPERYKVMGRPFDFTTQTLTGTMPQSFQVSDYISMANVGNTIMSVFDVDSSLYWKTSNNAPVAPILSSLIR